MPDPVQPNLNGGHRLASQPNTIAQGAGTPPSKEFPVPPELVDHPTYEVMELLGQGGMGAVYKARHKVMDRLVALKIINASLLGSSNAVERFHREVKAAAKLHHPNIVTAYDAGQAGDTHFLVMEFVAGTDLAQYVKQKGPLPISQACHFSRQAALALQHAHEHGMVHRDIKPANLILNAQGDVKVMDFGLARLTSEGAGSTGLTGENVLMGTADYIAPEQAQDARQADIRADIYSLGCSLYHLLAGQPPFRGNTVVEKITAHLMAPPPLAELKVPAGLGKVLARMMVKDPAQRCQTPLEVAQALEPFINKASVTDAKASGGVVGVAARGDATVDLHETRLELPKGKRSTGGRWRWLAGAAALLLVGVGVFFLSRLGNGPANQVPSSQPTDLSQDNSVAGLPPKFADSLGMKMLLIPKGKFLMGGSGGKAGTKEVTIPHDFYLGQYEVTQWEWLQVMKNNPSNYRYLRQAKPLTKEQQAKLTLDELQRLEVEEARDKENYWKSHPVENVSWEDCQEFIKRLNEKEKPAGWVYRLPSEAEWEYACRGDGNRPVQEYAFDYYFEQPTNMLLPEMANFKDSGKNRTCKVGSYKPNRLDLYDMHGNVWEWCRDEVPGDPKDPKATSKRVLRGGSWDFDSGYCRAASRLLHLPSARIGYLGLRLARVPLSEARVSVNPPPVVPLTIEEKEAKKQQADSAAKLKVPVETTSKLGMKLVLIPPSPIVDHAYYLGKYKVTQKEWQEVMGHNPSSFKMGHDKVAGLDTKNFPVEQVSWFESVEFCNKLSEREGLKPYYELKVVKRAKDGKAIDEAEVKILGGNGYHIPTDAEWEHACRAGTKTKYHCGNKDEDLLDYAWFDKNSDGRTHAVGELKPNGFGLYDMHGNVREWNAEMLTNATTGDPERVSRGGTWYTGASYCAVSYRHRTLPAHRDSYFGLRVARVPFEKAK